MLVTAHFHFGMFITYDHRPRALLPISTGRPRRKRRRLGSREIIGREKKKKTGQLF